jgi:putative membrane protein
MIKYNPKEWFSLIFRFHKADTFRILFPLMISIGIYSGIIVYLEIDYFHLDKEHSLKYISVLHSLLGFALSMLLVFRTNTAYDRWWEGRKLWGQLVNNSRGLAMKLSAMLPKEEESRAFFHAMIPNYAFILKNHLRKQFLPEEFENTAEMSADKIAANIHAPNKIALSIYEKLNELQVAGKISGEQMLFLNPELQAFADVCGACERIRNTPVPFSYSVFLKKFIFLYVMTLPLGNALSLRWLVIPIVILIFYALASLELIAEEIENPFGKDANDLSLDAIATGIRKTVQEII